MKNYSTKILFLLSITLLTNQADAVRKARSQRTSSRTRTCNRRTEETILRDKARLTLRQMYRDYLANKVIEELGSGYIFVINNCSEKDQDAFWLEFTALTAVLGAGDEEKITEILGQQIHGRLKKHAISLLNLNNKNILQNKTKFTGKVAI